MLPSWSRYITLHNNVKYLYGSVYMQTMYNLHYISILLKQEHWSTLVEEDEKDVLEWVACVKQNLLVLCYLHDVKVRELNCLLHFQNRATWTKINQSVNAVNICIGWRASMAQW